MPAHILLIVTVVLFVYPFALYPAVLFLVCRLRGKRPPPPLRQDDLPSVAIVICALNERHVIGKKLKNALELEYPKDKLRIRVISDGSTDGTSEIAKQFSAAGIEVIDQPKRRGKVTNFNEAVAALNEDVIVSSDANVFCHPKTLINLMHNFADPSVGCVSGKIIVMDTSEALKNSEEHYFSLEWFLQERASQLYSMAGVDGSMFAFRRELFRPCPNDTVIEDFVISMGIVRQGKRIVFDPTALATETGPTTVQEEFRRKVRIAAGAAQSLVRGNCWPGRVPLRAWFVFISHKLLRWLSPVIGLLVLLAAMLDWQQTIAKLIVIGFCMLAAAGLVRLITKWSNPLLDGAFYFLMGQLALLLGLVRGFRGTQSVLWVKANR